MPVAQAPQPAAPVLHIYPGMPMIYPYAAAPMVQDQIPRIGFNNNAIGMAPGVAGMMLNTVSKDPRQVRSYIDLDKPAEGDAPLNYG